MQIALNSRVDPITVTVGCEYYINSAEYGYCFRNMMKDLDGHPISDKEICKMLLITPAQLKDTYTSAIRKLSSPENRELMIALAEIVSEKGEDIDQSVYMPYEFHDKIGERNAITEDFEEGKDPYKAGKRGPKPKKKVQIQGMGMPVHHSKKRLDIYFGYIGDSRRGEIEENKKRIKKSKTDDKKED